MDVHVRDEIDCALLFDHFYPPPNVPSIIAFLNAVFPGSGFKLAGGGQDDRFFLLTGNGPVFVLVSSNRGPLPAEGFREALHSPYQQLLAPRIDEAVADHSCNVFITVSHKPPPGDLVNPVLKISTQPASLVERKILICQRLTQHLAARLEATAIHWRQSNQLLTPQLFETAMAHDRFPSPLHVHPHLFSSGEPADGRRAIGFRTFGARDVIGKEIVSSESTADLLWMYARALKFLQMARLDGYRLIPNGHCFGGSADEVIRVRNRPAEEDGIPLIELTVEKSLEQGIAAMPAPAPAAQQPSAPVFGKRKRL